MLWKQWQPSDPSFLEFNLTGEQIMVDQLDLFKLFLEQDFLNITNLGMPLSELLSVGKHKYTLKTETEQ